MNSKTSRFAFTVAVLLLGTVQQSMSQTCAFHDSSPHRVQFVAMADGAKLEVLDWGGKGQPILLLAGYMTAHAYDDIAPKLTSFAHVYALTRRGLGASTKTPSGYSARESAQDVLQVLDSLKLDKVILAGHSFGGQDLNTIGETHPDRVAGLVYLNSAEDISLGPVSQSVDWPKPAELPPALQKPPEPDQTSFAAYRTWQMKTYGMAFPEAELHQLFACNADGTVGEYLVPKTVRDAMFTGLTKPEYSRITVPVLALYALPRSLKEQLKRYPSENFEQAAALGLKYGLDLAWVARNADDLKRGIPGARVVEIPSANTYVFLSNAAEVVHEMKTFLEGLH